MGEPLATVLALKRLLSGVNPLMLLQMMFELESFATVLALEFPKVRAVCMIGHVSLELVECRKLLAA